MDQPQFYTLVTSLLNSNLLVRFSPLELIQRILIVSKMLDGGIKIPAPLEQVIKEFLALSAKQTTHSNRREARQQLFIRAIDAVELKN
jgi:hypothetical protein